MDKLLSHDEVTKCIYTKEDLEIRIDDIKNISVDINLLENKPEYQNQYL